MKNITKRCCKIGAAVLVLCFVWAVYQYVSISLEGEREITEKSDVIIILGAAVWPNGPSPALQGRVAKGSELYRDGLAPKLAIIISHDCLLIYQSFNRKVHQDFVH
ncbi:MAG: hypothetical protein AB1420_18720 [Bacillota bacterium]